MNSILLYAALLFAPQTLQRGAVYFSTDFNATAALKEWHGTVVLEREPSGRQGVRIESRSGGATISRSLPAAPVRGCQVTVHARLRAENVSAKPQPWNGVKCMLAIDAPSGKQWPQAELGVGSFDWRDVQYSVRVPRDATSISLILGLEAVTGTVWFDTIRITVTRGPAPERPRRPGPMFRGHDEPRLRGVMISPDISDESLRLLGQEWKPNLIRWQLIRTGAASRDDTLDGYDRWLERELKRLDAALPLCRQYGIKVVVDLHSPPGGKPVNGGYAGSDNGLFTDKASQAHFLDVWRKIAARYRGDKTIWGFDLANEPVENAVGEGLSDWQELVERAGKAVRSVDPGRTLIVEPSDWGNPAGLDHLTPLDLPNVVYSVHMYMPHTFTHQGVHSPSGPITYPGVIDGKRWDKAALEAALEPVVEFQRRYNVHIYVGEFSAIRWAPGAAQYLSDLIDIFESHGWDWSYHAFREWSGWSVEHTADRSDEKRSTTPTDRQLVLSRWFSQHQKPTPRAHVSAKPPLVRRSDVAFMYEADRRTYDAYGATILAWGGTPTPARVKGAAGVKWFGSVGMVTEFARYYDRFPATYELALCRDIDGKPVKVPWLTDMSHKGVPFWWCCTNQPQFRQFIRERVVEIVKGGAAGLHVDDHMGTAGGLWLGICFCDRCVEGFKSYLAALPAAERSKYGIGDPATYDYRASVKAWLAEDSAHKRQVTQHPLWSVWTAYQCKAAASFMVELRHLAAETAGRTVPVAANAGLLWPRHLADYKALDLFVAETDHAAATRKTSDSPLVAYRLAEAVGRPYAATASGMDWAYIKEHNLPGLVRCWIALAYAGGQLLMAPTHQWCYTPEKGTHWWDGPTEKFAPLYQFVRSHASLFDDYETYADVAVVMPHRSFAADPNRWISLCDRLSAANISYRILLAGDDVVDHPVTSAALGVARSILAPDLNALSPSDEELVARRERAGGFLRTVDEALSSLRPAVTAPRSVRALPRVKQGSAVVHLLNQDYDSAADNVRPQSAVIITLDLKALGVPGAKSCRLVAPGSEPATLPIIGNQVVVPSLGLWTLLVVDR